MPVKPLKPCNKMGCPELTNEKYCSKHTEQVKVDKAEANKLYDLYARDEKSAKFYKSKEWIKLRTVAFQRDNGLCQDCLEEKKIKPGDVVDHIIEIKDNWDLRLDISNLKTLCHRHHNEKTAKVKKERENKEKF
ncbi:HNH endonuclease [Fictibacillus nanhaiensis]|uniref:HNH endonuclease n=1 Tax=Fictibacillus nanhaiensis TaxID=742169 RepID=UPI00203F3789|nr:HNH endonuclease signature motif containing protein [Fictibacillus nanhaiensis]MCM3730060.1 HNH endonuclease [Fictibacillus nanhaiensis]